MSLKDNLELKEDGEDKGKGNYMALGMAFGTLAG